MEFFNNAKTVRLKSHLDKYLVADDDQETVRQSQDGASRKARWSVELVEADPHVIRLKSCHGGYLTASDEQFLLGMTGKKVLQAFASARRDAGVEWEPIREGDRVRLRAKGGKFLRANGAMPPWRNSVTHDLPHRTATQDWVMWDVDMVDVSVLDDEYLPPAMNSPSSFSENPSYPNSPRRSGSGPGTPVAAEGLRKSPFAAEGLRKSPFAAERLRPSFLSNRSFHGNSNNRQDFHLEQDGQGMEFFTKAKTVRLQSHLGKFLMADEDQTTVRQSRNGASRNARWSVEFVEGKRNRIRLKSSHGLYLTAAEEPFLLGMTGKKVLQTQPERPTDVAIEWQPVKEGQSVKLMTEQGKFLRGNGGAPPWRNSVTHDVPHRTATQSWVMWGVEVVDITLTDPGSDPGSGFLSEASSFSSIADDYSGSPDTGSPMSRNDCESGYMSMKQGSSFSSMSYDYLGSPDTGSPMIKIGRGSEYSSMKKGSNSSSIADDYSCSPDTESPMIQNGGGLGYMSMKKVSGIEFFKKAKSVRLKSHHNKYLTADSDEEHVIQDRSGSSKSVKWEVEFVEGSASVIRLKSCYGKYLRAEDEEFLLGVTGRKVLQALPPKLDSSVEWEPLRDGMLVKLKTRYGNFLRANGGLPPFRNSITHDIPHRHHGWILWEVDVVDIRPDSPRKVERSVSLEVDDEEDLSSTSFYLTSPRNKPRFSTEDSSRKSCEGRLIFYYVADDDGNVNSAIAEESFPFKGQGMQELKRKFEEITGVDDIIICSRNIVNGKLYPLRLALPPNNVTMHVVVVRPTSRVAKEFHI